jgi:hypothetical protein
MVPVPESAVFGKPGSAAFQAAQRWNAVHQLEESFQRFTPGFPLGPTRYIREAFSSPL